MRTFIYDADCGFCTRSAKWLASNGRVSIKPWQGIPDLEAVGLNEMMVTEAAFWLADGKVSARGEAAIARALISRGNVWAIAGRIILLPVIRQLAAFAYTHIAANRHRMPGGTNACKISN
ncbi:thiol-disulfide oxidoreductase DCC family protein [Arthrobacter sp. B1805]|uniref:thiol-disulfide oxidoreductase DCC family protein n=1 Tax=Arthrobacter sp. B1805 TaxID=2058892 RepID=UPI000CE36CAC|nr:DCC1-like thiol-disulfide oxidoreductase family protein [Arthrobacter sp. B1805]